MVVCYLATAPNLFAGICENLAAVGLNSGNVRVVLEKPLGTDLDSSNEINDDVARFFKEEQLYRIDHYLGKESVQNLMAIRFANALFEPLWRREWIHDVQITISEDLGVGAVVISTTAPARCATWCRTTCCNCCASWRWSRRPIWKPTRCATRSSRC